MRLFSSLLLFTLLAAPFAAFAEGPTISVLTENDEIQITEEDGWTTSTIEFADSTKDLQVVRIKRNDTYYLVVLRWVKQKVRLMLLDMDGKKIDQRLVFVGDADRQFTVTRLTPVERDGRTAFRVRAIKTTVNGRPGRLLQKEFYARPNSDTPLKRASSTVTKLFPLNTAGLSNENAGLAFLNYERNAAGLLPVDWSDASSDTCALHAEYMRINKELSHSEDSSKPGYTEEGNDAGQSSNLLTQRSSNMPQAIATWTEAIYHRLPMVRNNLRAIGWAISSADDEGKQYACLNVWDAHDFSALTEMGDQNNVTYYNPDNHEPIPYPGVRQQDVPTTFDSGEIPDPLDAFGGEYPAGFPISLTFSEDDTVTNLSMKLLHPNGEALKGYFRAPEDESDPYTIFQGNSVTFIPEAPLSGNTTYTAVVNGKRNGEEYSKSWTFTTE